MWSLCRQAVLHCRSAEDCVLHHACWLSSAVHSLIAHSFAPPRQCYGRIPPSLSIVVCCKLKLIDLCIAVYHLLDPVVELLLALLTHFRIRNAHDKQIPLRCLQRFAAGILWDRVEEVRRIW